MIEKTLVARGVRLRTLRALDQVTQSLQCDLGRELPVHDLTLDHNGNRRQRHATGGDTYGSVRISLVANEAIIRIGLAEIVKNSGELEETEFSLGEYFIQIIAGAADHHVVRSWLLSTS